MMMKMEEGQRSDRTKATESFRRLMSALLVYLSMYRRTLLTLRCRSEHHLKLDTRIGVKLPIRSIYV